MTNGIDVDVEGGPIAEDVSSAVTAAAAQSPVVSEPGVRTRKCAECPARANGAGTQAASSDGLSRSGLSVPGAGWASAAQT